MLKRKKKKLMTKEEKLGIHMQSTEMMISQSKQNQMAKI